MTGNAFTYRPRNCSNCTQSYCMLVLHLSLGFGFVSLQLEKTEDNKTEHNICLDGGRHKNGVLFSLVFVSRFSAVWFNMNADLAVTFIVQDKSTPVLRYV